MSEIDVTKCEFCKRVCKNTKEPTVICLLYGYCSENQNCYHKQLHRYKQVVKEIKEIAENFCNACKEFEPNKCNEINLRYCNYNKIIQKCEEVDK